MTPDLVVLLAASMVALQIVSLVVRREHREDAPYLGLLAACFAALVFAHVTHRDSSMLAFVAESAAAVLVFGPRLIDLLERSALGQDALARAARLGRVRELIAPGRTAARRRRQLEDLAAARAGNGAQVARRIRDELEQAAHPAQAIALREELATVLFFDQRYAEGVAEVERHLGVEHIAHRPAFAAYLLRAYGETGQLARAAAVMALLEEGPAGRDPAAAGLIAQARLTFLAFAGCVAHVEALLAGRAGMTLPERAHEFLLQVARTRALREVPAEAEVRALAETVFRRASLPGGADPARPKKRSPATLALVGLNLAVFGAVSLFTLHDGAILVRAGALFRPALHAGEWWRLATAMFLHADWMHVGVNVYGLYLLGRFTENLFGAARFLIVYVLSGLAGAAASTLLGAGALSVGASGAVMGLLGALIVTLLLRRGNFPEAWRRALLMNLVLLAAMQIYIGFQVARIDNAAHLGGLGGGALATLLFAPGGPIGDGARARRVLATLAGLLVAGVLACGVLALTTPLEKTLARVATHDVVAGGVRLTVPTYWDVDTEHGRVEDSYLDLTVTPRLEPEGARIDSAEIGDPRFSALLERIARSAKKDGP